MRRVRGVVAVLVALAVCAGAAGARDRGGPDPQVEAQADGCTRDLAAVGRREEPAWAYVGDAALAATDPAPSPRWLEGTVSSTRLPFLAVHPSTVSDPGTHDAYDLDVDVRPDPGSASLLGAANAGGAGDGAGRLQVERETLGLPTFAWPEPGDRVSVLGSWVWDCTRWLPAGERTELHPFRVLWVVRRFSPRSPTGESEGDLFVTTDPTPAGVVAECAHLAKGEPTVFQACLTTQPRWQDVSGDYTFTLPAPPRPPGSGPLEARVVDAGGGPDPTVALGARDATVTLHLAVAPGRRLVVAKEVFVGWSDPPRAALPEHLRVRFRSLLVRRALDPGVPGETTQPRQVSRGPLGEWNVYWDVAGLWGTWTPRVLDVGDGQLVLGRQAVDVYVPRRTAWRVLTFARECDQGWRAFSDPSRAPWPCPTQDELASAQGDDVPGVTVDAFASPELGLGLHASIPQRTPSTCPAANPQGCYRLEYVVIRVG
jgi:hypothetical protein